MASTTTALTANGITTDALAGSVVVYQLTGTLSLTVTFESTVDGVNWVATGAFPIAESGTAATTATAVGIWRIRAAGLTGVRARVTAFTSQTAAFIHGRSYDHDQIAA